MYEECSIDRPGHKDPDNIIGIPLIQSKVESLRPLYDDSSLISQS